MNNTIYPYQPSRGSGNTYAPNASSVAIVLKKDCRQYCVTNLLTTTIYVRANPGTDATAATIADQAVLGGASRIFTKAGDDVAGAVFCAGAGSVHVSSGNGF